jgi:hypothetical protein
LFPYWAYRLFGRGRTFIFRGRSLRYFYHRYNDAWRTERTVEIAIAVDALQRFRTCRVLEIGNVLQHYHPEHNHVVVDKYEKASKVLNVDVLDYESEKLFDLIFTISTLEHVGWDEHPRDPEKPIRAIRHLKTLLAPDGRLLVTIPLGYNEYLDRAIEKGCGDFDRVTYLARRTQSGRWEQQQYSHAIKHRGYNNPYPGAAAVAVCEYQHPPARAYEETSNNGLSI